MISLLVISDIHACSNDLNSDDAVSWVSTLPIYDTDLRNPFRSIPALLEREKLAVDFLICPGDIADRADPTAQGISWRFLEDLKSALGARRLVATVGNHDVDSRLQISDFDPKANLQSLTPLFPGLTENECDFFWSRNFVVLEEGAIRFLILNSCAFHGIHSDHKDRSYSEFIHGRVSDRTIEAIFQRVQDRKFALNILVVHHHIYKSNHIFSDDYSEMVGGGKLIRTLVDANAGPWFAIHGHQHYPELYYAPGSANSATILSAGSMSRRLSGPLVGRASNQIYHIELPIEQYAEIGWKPVGFTRAWDWVDQGGWKRTSFKLEGAAIPYGAGFGCRKDAEAWASEILTELRGTTVRRLNWNELLRRLPALRYVLPADLRTILKHLKNSTGVTIFYDDDGLPAEVCQS